MATDINEQVSNAYNAAKQALNDDLRQQLYSATQARNQAFRQLNNKANANHAMYSGAPAGMQMQYDAGTYLPGIASAASNALKKYKENQESWDKYMDYVNQLNSQADYYNSLASQANNAAYQYTNATAGFKTNAPKGANDDAYSAFAGN